MTRWHVHRGEILEAPADGLVCSANVQLNLSGGVGGAILQRYGNAMQLLLHQYLRDHGLRHVAPGVCVMTPSCGTPFRWIAHAVASDGFCDTNSDVIEQTYQSAFAQLAERGCRTVVASCLGCGYGRFPADEFASVAARIATEEVSRIDQVTLVTTNEELAELIGTAFRERSIIA